MTSSVLARSARVALVVSIVSLAGACSSGDFAVPGGGDDAAADSSIVTDSGGVEVAVDSTVGDTIVSDTTAIDSSIDVAKDSSTDSSTDVAKESSTDAITFDGPTCVGDSAAFPTFDKGCTNDVSCSFGLHQINCCGSQAAIGLNHAFKVDFEKYETAWRATCPACGCASGGISLDDGEVVGDPSLVGVKCDGGQCRTYKK